MSQIMKPLTEARLSVILYRYDPVEVTVLEALLSAISSFHEAVTGRALAVTATVQGPFAVYLNDAAPALAPAGAARSKRDVMLLLESAFEHARQPAGPDDGTAPPGSDIIRAMAVAARRCQADVQVNYKSDQERKSVLLTRMEAETVLAKLAGLPHTPRTSAG